MRNRDNDLDWKDYNEEFKTLLSEDQTIIDILYDFVDSGYSTGYVGTLINRLEVLEENALNRRLEGVKGGL